MTFRYADYTKQITGAAIGTGAFVFTGTPTGFAAFSAIPSVANGDRVPYAAWDGAGNREVGVGTYNTGGSVTRTTVLRSTNSNNPVVFVNPVTVWCDAPAALTPLLDQNGNLGLGSSAGTPQNLIDGRVDQNSSTIFRVINGNGGTAASAKLSTVNGSAHEAALVLFGGGFATSGSSRADGMLLYCNGAGGMAFEIPSDAYRWFFGATAVLQVTSTLLQFIGTSGITAAGATFVGTVGGGYVQCTGFGVQSALDIDGSILTTSGNGIRMQCVSAGVILNNGANSWAALSSKAYKKNIRPIANGAVARLGKLSKVLFNYNEDPDGAPLKPGTFYEDAIAAGLEYVTSYTPASEQVDAKTGAKRQNPERKSLSLELLVPDLLKAIDELSAEIAALKARG